MNQFPSFRTYSVLDTNSNNTDPNYKYALKYYLQESNMIETGAFVLDMKLKYGSTYIVHGFKHSAGYIVGLVMTYSLNYPVYFYCRNNVWEFKNVGVQ